MKVKENLKRFILEKVKQNTSPDKPYYFIKWSGLFELCRAYNVDLLDLIDQMEEEGLIKKALLPSKKDKKKKILAIYLPEIAISQKAKSIINEFEAFLKR